MNLKVWIPGMDLMDEFKDTDLRGGFEDTNLRVWISGMDLNMDMRTWIEGDGRN